MLRMELIIDAKAQLGEGPLWDVAEERLYWIDRLGPAVHACDAKSGRRKTWRLPEPVGSLGAAAERRRHRALPQERLPLPRLQVGRGHLHRRPRPAAW